jgi:hypothetical protein
MKKIARILSVGLALALLLPAYPSRAQSAAAVERLPLMIDFDLDGEAADADQVLDAAGGIMADATDYTAAIVAQPDICRLVDITVNDVANITAGTLTIVGTDCLGFVRTCTWAFTAADDDGVKTLTCNAGKSAHYAAITSITTGPLTGEGGADTITVGYTNNSLAGWGAYGVLATSGPLDEHSVNILASYPSERLITTSGALSTTVTTVGANAAFDVVRVNDLLLIQLPDQRGALQMYTRKVTAKASSNSITIASAINIPADGVTFRFKRFYFSTDPFDNLGVMVAGYRTARFDWGVQANASTGGVVTRLACAANLGTPAPIEVTIAQPITTIATGATTVDGAGAYSAISETINLEGDGGLGYLACKQSFRFGTNDDADAGAVERIHLYVTLVK